MSRLLLTPTIPFPPPSIIFIIIQTFPFQLILTPFAYHSITRLIHVLLSRMTRRTTRYFDLQPRLLCQFPSLVKTAATPMCRLQLVPLPTPTPCRHIRLDRHLHYFIVLLLQTIIISLLSFIPQFILFRHPNRPLFHPFPKILPKPLVFGPVPTSLHIPLLHLQTLTFFIQLVMPRVPCRLRELPWTQTLILDPLHPLHNPVTCPASTVVIPLMPLQCANIRLTSQAPNHNLTDLCPRALNITFDWSKPVMLMNARTIYCTKFLLVVVRPVTTRIHAEFWTKLMKLRTVPILNVEWKLIAGNALLP